MDGKNNQSAMQMELVSASNGHLFLASIWN